MTDKIFSILIEEVHDHRDITTCKVVSCQRLVIMTGKYPFIIWNEQDVTTEGKKE